MVDIYATAAQHLAAFRDGTYSPSDLLEAQIERIEQLDGSVNAMVWTDLESAREQAKSLTGGPTAEQPLRGISMTVKEAYNITGSPTTWGIPEYANNIDRDDALAIQRLRAAGAIIFGKTNVPKDLADLQSYNDIYGQTNNPWNYDHTPGGSSGGSGAALAAGYTSIEMGSDIGGSIRTPAHYNGVFGHKPTWALIPSRGHALPGAVAEPDIAVIGPMARSAQDLETMLDILAGADDFEPGVRYELPGLADGSLKGLRVAVWANDEAAPVSAETQDRVHAVAKALADAGATVDDAARPAFTGEASNAVYQPMLWSFMSVGTPEEEFAELQAQVANSDPADNSRAMEMARMATLPHRSWVRLNHARDSLRWAWHRFFQDYDIVLAPQTATAAMKHDHSPMGGRTIMVDGVERPYFEQIFWAGLVGISRLPSTVIPTGPNADGLPIGVQIIGNAYSDRLTIQVAQQLEAQGFAFQAPPER